MNRSRTNRLPVALTALAIAACSGTPESEAPRMVEVLLTSESGHKQASMDVASFQRGTAKGTVITVDPDRTKQTIDGIGTSFTESSAFVLAHLEPERRREVMQRIYGESGANFTLTRTHIGSCDFTVEGKYSYADQPDDKDLRAFSIAPDLAGFDPAKQADIAFRVGTMGRTSPEVIARVEEALQSKLGKVSSAEISVKGGIEDLAEVLNNTDRTTEKSILERLGRIDSELTEQVRALMFVFEDLVTLDDRSIQRVLQEVESKELALAMKGVPREVNDAILRNMSQRAAETLTEELELLGAVRRADVEGAQGRIVAGVRRLEEAGEIVIARAGESDLIE